jgi:single-stranded DNA-binding protein
MSSLGQNVCCFVGNVAGEPRFEPAKVDEHNRVLVASRLFFDIAVNGRTKRGEQWVSTVNFIPVLLRGKQAESGADYIGKGKQLAITGELITRRKDNADGSYTKTFFVAASSCNYGPDSKATREEQAEPPEEPEDA